MFSNYVLLLQFISVGAWVVLTNSGRVAITAPLEISPAPVAPGGTPVSASLSFRVNTHETWWFNVDGSEFHLSSLGDNDFAEFHIESNTVLRQKVDIRGQLNVTGPMHAQNSVIVGGHTELQTLTANKEVEFYSSLSVGDVTRLGSSLSVSSKTLLGGTLSVQDHVQLGNMLSVFGSTIFDSSAHFHADLKVDKNAMVYSISISISE
eukprot:GEMP01114356.1.p1 GENE.GEMP01114356.1~~GEMP01114356.1.p1  ORF type:complete len:214 (+),score=6.81 GEMP01114356.1:24-644(+)